VECISTHVPWRLFSSLPALALVSAGCPPGPIQQMLRRGAAAMPASAMILPMVKRTLEEKEAPATKRACLKALPRSPTLQWELVPAMSGPAQRKLARLRPPPSVLARSDPPPAVLARELPASSLRCAAPKASAAVKRQARRGVRRTKTAAAVPQLPGVSYLEQQAIGDGTKRNYLKALAQFDLFCGENNLKVETPALLDAALVEFMNSAYLEGHQAFVGNTLLAAVCWRRPAWGRPKDAVLPRCKQALHGWRRLSPAASRLPLVWEMIAGMAMMLIGSNRWELGAALLIGTVFYLRPNELLGLRVRSLVAPLPEAGPAHCRWTLLLHEYVDEESLPSKTKEFDETLSLDLPRYQFLGGVFERLLHGRRPNAPLFDFSMKELAEAMRETGKRLGVSYPVLPYQLRHTGASTDFATGDRSLLAIRRRGRWRAERSVRRYEKGSQLTRLLRALPCAARTFCVESAKALPAVLSRRVVPLRFPGR
jgi:hypothetical protein